jgi:hypothetical protein
LWLGTDWWTKFDNCSRSFRWYLNETGLWWMLFIDKCWFMILFYFIEIWCNTVNHLHCLGLIDLVWKWWFWWWWVLKIEIDCIHLSPICTMNFQLIEDSSVICLIMKASCWMDLIPVVIWWVEWLRKICLILTIRSKIEYSSWC